jgi:hypothetical protein
MPELFPDRPSIPAAGAVCAAPGWRLATRVSLPPFAPTGSGKTVIAAAITASAVAGGRRVLVLVSLRDDSIEPGVIQADFADDPGATVQVAGDRHGFAEDPVAWSLARGAA